jgi:hypothetical protein
MWSDHLLTVALPRLLIPTAALLVCARWGKAALAGDFPEDVRALMPDFTDDERRRGTLFATLFLVSLLATTFIATYSWIDGVRAAGFGQAYGMALATFVAFCLIDLVIVDWIIVCWWRPSWIVIHGTETAAGWGDYMFHVREQLSPKGLAALFGVPLVIAAVATVARAVF